MKNFCPKTAARLWVLATLLAFAAQVVGVSANAAIMIRAPESVGQVMPDCHDDGDQIAPEGENLKRTQVLQSCCGADCSKMGCQAAYAMLNSVVVSHQILSSSLSYFARSSSPLQRHNSLYRPPILG